MESRDQSIIDGLFARRESAISEMSQTYGGYCRTVADNILNSREDAEECLNDTWLRAWNTIPPARPDSLRAYLGRIVRNLAISRYREHTSQKRGGSTYALALDELAECAQPSDDNVESESERRELVNCINRFLQNQTAARRDMFVERYFYCDPVKDIALHHGASEARVKTTLFRMRKQLKEELER